MFTLPFLRKNSRESERYIFILYLSGEKVYGYGFEENLPENQSSLYQEHIDPFLKDATPVIEKIISNCERDLGENVYLKKTVLVLNSLYTTESGAIREDFLQQIKKLLKALDLDNLGYLNFYEVVLSNFSKSTSYYFLEESLYDLTLYFVEKGAIKKVDKVSKSENWQESLKEIEKIQKENYDLITFLYKNPEKLLKEAKHKIAIEDLPKLFTRVYFNDKKNKQPKGEPIDEKQPQIEEKTEKIDLEMAPGFLQPENEALEITEEPLVSSTAFVSEPITKTKFKFNFDFIRNWKFPNFKYSYLIMAALILILLFATYFLFFYKAEVKLETKKENFSTNINFAVKESNNFVKRYENEIEVTSSGATTGEKVTGEKAIGEITIYNGLFEKKDLEQGDIFVSKSGEEFAIDESISIPSATTSADLDQGLVTKAYGKKTVGVTAVSIGAEGNLDSGSKLTYSNLGDEDFYAMANNNFNGGFKKTVAVFSEQDAKTLDKKALVLAKNKLINNFKGIYDATDVLFRETISAVNVKKTYSQEVGDEATKATLNYKGKIGVFYVPYNQLVEMVQQQELKDKEFVDRSLQLKKIKLISSNNGAYRYSALVIGQVQNFIDKKELLKKMKGKPVFKAKQILAEQTNIVDFEIKTKPLPLLIMPVFEKAIKLEFVK